MRRALTTLAVVAASLAWAAPASADVDGFDVNIGQAPATFTIGNQARPVTAVATTDRERRCFKVRWSLTIETEGISLDQIRVERVENGGAFRVRTALTDDQARVTDVQPDPGQLCQDQTVTGRWDISFTGPDDGNVTLTASALDAAGGRELNSVTISSRVVTPVAAKPSATPSESPSPSESPTDSAAEATDPVDDDTPDADATSSAALNPTAGTPSVLGPGLIIGAVLVFLGVALLLRIRTRNRKATDPDPAWQTETQNLPTGFYSMPRRRR